MTVTSSTVPTAPVSALLAHVDALRRAMKAPRFTNSGVWILNVNPRPFVYLDDTDHDAPVCVIGRESTDEDSTAPEQGKTGQALKGTAIPDTALCGLRLSQHDLCAVYGPTAPTTVMFALVAQSIIGALCKGVRGKGGAEQSAGSGISKADLQGARDNLSILIGGLAKRSKMILANASVDNPDVAFGCALLHTHAPAFATGLCTLIGAKLAGTWAKAPESMPYVGALSALRTALESGPVDAPTAHTVNPPESNR